MKKLLIVAFIASTGIINANDVSNTKSYVAAAQDGVYAAGAYVANMAGGAYSSAQGLASAAKTFAKDKAAYAQQGAVTAYNDTLTYIKAHPTETKVVGAVVATLVTGYVAYKMYCPVAKSGSCCKKDNKN